MKPLKEYESILEIRVNILKQKLFNYKCFRLHEFLKAYNNITNFTIGMHMDLTALINRLSIFLSKNTIKALDGASIKDDDFKLEAINQALLNDKKKLIDRE